MDFEKANIDNYIKAEPYLRNEKICEFGITPTCLYAPLDTGAFSIKDGFLIFTCIENKERYFSITGDFSKKEKIKDIISELKEQFGKVTLKFLTKERAEIISQLYGIEKENIKTDPDQYDYIYRTEDFINLSGKAVQRKRAAYNAFIKENVFTYKEIEKSDRDACMEIVNCWCERKDCSQCEYTCEKKIMENLFDRWDDYPVKGGMIYIEGIPQALLICETLGNTTMGYHQKTRTTNIKGLSYGIYIETIKRTFAENEYFNIGPDMGVLGLRQFKRQFKPFEMVEKFEITL